MRKIILSLFLLTFLDFSVMAQKTKAKSDEPDNKNIEKYLNDGRKGNSSNLIRLRLAPASVVIMVPVTNVNYLIELAWKLVYMPIWAVKVSLKNYAHLMT